MLKIAGYSNFMLAIMLVVYALGTDLWSNTQLVALLLVLFGGYGLSGVGVVKPLPYLNHMLLIIAFVFLGFGLWSLCFAGVDIGLPFSRFWAILLSILLGLGYLIGGVKRIINQKLNNYWG